MPEDEWGYRVSGREIDWDPGVAYPEWALNWRQPHQFLLLHPAPTDIPEPTPREAGGYEYDPTLPMSFFNPHAGRGFVDPRRELLTGEPLDRVGDLPQEGSEILGEGALERPRYEGPWTREQWLSTVEAAPPAPTGPRRLTPREALWNLNLGRAGAVGEGGALRELAPERFRGTSSLGRYALQSLQELYPERAQELLGEFTGGGGGWEGTDLYKGTQWNPEMASWLTGELGQGELGAGRFGEAFSELYAGQGYAAGGGRFRPWEEAGYLDEMKDYGTPKEWMQPVMREARGQEFNIVYPEARKEYERLRRMDLWDAWAKELERLRAEREREWRRQMERGGGGNGGDGYGGGSGGGGGDEGASYGGGVGVGVH